MFADTKFMAITSKFVTQLAQASGDDSLLILPELLHSSTAAVQL
jgi:hypothetical protein